jgi:GTP cyclohydrolase I
MPRRVARMMGREVFRGRYQPQPVLTDFPNIGSFDQFYAGGPIAVRSCCAHHLVPITGRAWIGIVPSNRVIGLSKFDRLTDWIMARPQIQEEATEQLADALETAIAPRALGVIVRARHLCCG